jgi:RecB family exonuclease
MVTLRTMATSQGICYINTMFDSFQDEPSLETSRNARLRRLVERSSGTRILLCPSPDIGAAWLREAQVTNVTPMNFWQWVVDYAQPLLAEAKLCLIHPLEQEALVSQLWNIHKSGLSDKAIAQIGSGDSLLTSLTATLHELRMAGLEAESLSPDAWSAKEKAKLLHSLLSDYEDALVTNHWADPARLCALVRDHLIQVTLLDSICFIIPGELKFRGLLQSVLDHIPEEQKASLHTIALEDRDGADSDCQRLAWVTEPAAAPPVFNDGTVKLHRALSPELEARAVFGMLLQQGIPFGQAEVLYSDESIYPELFRSILSATQIPRSSITPICFRGGVPLRWTKPGRALRFWLDWIGSDFASDGLAELLLQDLLVLPTGCPGPELLQALHHLPYFRSREAWPEQIEKLINTRRNPAIQRAANALLALVQGLMKLALPVEGPGFCEAVLHFTQHHTRLCDAWDHQALAIVQAYTSAFSQESLTQAELRNRMLIWLETAVLPAESLQPGQLALTPLRLEHSLRRPHTFVVGLAEDLFPTMPDRSSLLSDRERKALSPELAQQSLRELLHQQDQATLVLLAEAQGHFVFMYPCADQLDDRERFPSQLFMRVFRLQAGLPEGDLHDLETWLEAPLGTQSPVCRLTTTEEWLDHWPDQPFKDALFKHDFPLLCRGAYAAAQRKNLKLTAHDGFVPDAGNLFDSHYRYSAHSLQRLARCPLQFFYHEVLRLEAPEHLEEVTGRWLHPVIRGEVLHTIFHHYHLELVREQRLPDKLADMPRLLKLLNETLEKWKPRLPEVTSYVREAEINELKETLHIFLGEETQWAERHVPRYFETALGLPVDSPLASDLDTQTPMSFRLPSGRSVLLQGRVDRIDAIVARETEGGPPHFFVWDYKTGKMRSYQSQQARQSGQLLQPLLYLEMVEKRLRDVVHAEACVEGAGYFFPGQRGGQGDRLLWQAVELRQDVKVIDTLLDILQGGLFLPTDDGNICEQCDHQDACDLNDVNKQARSKLRFTQNAMLGPLRVLRRS